MEELRKQVVITRIEDKIVSAYMIGESIYDVIVEDEDELHVGDVFVGRVKNVVENISAAFVELNPGVMGYLRLEKAQIKEVKAEQDLIVQIKKTAKGAKDAVISTNVELVGRYSVLQDGEKSGVYVSKKIRDEETIDRLRELGERVVDGSDETAPAVTIRTNAADVKEADILKEIRELYVKWLEIRRFGGKRTPLSRLYREPPVYLRMINQYRTGEIHRVVTDQEDVREELTNLPSEISVEWYEDDSYPLEARYAIRTALEKARERHVWLKSGASLIIDRTEAMTVIDVNTAKAIQGKRASESTFFKINMEAADEIARQLRIRNLSGIIMVDFIDMKEKQHIDALADRLKELLKKDPVMAVYVDMTKLGIVEITRTKRYTDIYDAFNNTSTNNDFS